MFMRMEDRAAAVREYREAVRVKPDHANAHYNLGIALHGSGDLDGAIVDFYETVRLKPDFEAAKQNLRIAVQRRSGRPPVTLRLCVPAEKPRAPTRKCPCGLFNRPRFEEAP
jgi:tetratricopeptide (TPR) repeat protein